MKPFVLWAGGKSKIKESILRFIPYNFDTYYEPMIGSGAIFFELMNEKHQRMRKSIIADCNKQLIELYKVIKCFPEYLIQELKSSKYANTEGQYYKIRALNPEDPNDELYLNPIKSAARFLFLNRTCFNGLYRVNKNGKFNVPFGKHKLIKINIDNIIECSKALNKNVQIQCIDFEKLVYSAHYGDVVYFDPPYHKTFNKYSQDGFTEKDQIRLSETFKKLANKNVKVILSNSNTKLIQELYQKFHIHEIKNLRTIGGLNAKRGQQKELIITNV